MRGLLMIEPLYHRTVRGLKTQTRRSSGLEEVNGREATKKKPAIITNPDHWLMIGERRDGSFHFEEKPTGRTLLLDYVICKPRYKVGEILYLKEPYIIVNTKWKYGYKFELAADSEMRDNVKWKNELFMPSAVARTYVRITGIKCERLLDISDRDCIAEGIEQVKYGYWKDYNPAFGKLFAKPKDSFISLYIFANKMKRTDEVKNIWVFCYTFEHLKDFKP